MSGQTVTCSGADNDGFQAGGGVNQLTVNVQTGAAVNNIGGTAIGLNNLNTVNNDGTIAAGDDGTGISAGNRNTITNAATGTITVGDVVSSPVFGVLIGDNNTLTNLGTIQVGSGCLVCGPAGAISGVDRNTITNMGPILGGNLSFGIQVDDRNTITNSAAITLGNDSLGIGGGNNNVITNTASGTITVGEAVDLGSFGIQVNNGNAVTNFGTITVGGSCGCFPAVGIDANNGNTIVNNGTIVGGHDSIGLNTGNNNIISNVGAITIGNADVFGAFGISAFNGNTITNAGTIAVGDGTIFAFSGVVGINANDNNTIVNTGSITVGAFGFGIQVFDGNTITNNGMIKVGDNGAGVQLGNNNVFTNNGTVRAGAFGASVVACFCDQNNTVINNGTLDGQISLEGTGHSVTNNGLITVTAPGSPVGAPHLIDGSFTQSATGTLALRVDNTGLSDTLTVTTANLGGTLRATVQPGLYGSSTFYAGVVTASDPITTTFAQTSTSSAFFTATATYNANSVDLTLNRVPFGSVQGATQNQRNVGNYLEQNYSTNLTGNAATFFAALLQAPSLGVLDQLSGAGTTGAQHGAFSAGTMFNKSMMDQLWSWLDGGGSGTSDLNPESTLLQYAASTKKPARPEYKAFAAIRPASGAFQPQQWRAWATAFGGSQSLRGDAVVGSPDASNRTFGGAGGFDYQVSPNLLLGFAAAGTSTEFSATSLSTSGRLEAAHLGVYGAYRWGATHVAGTLSCSHFENDTNRIIAGAGPTETAKGQFGSDQFGGRLQAGHKFTFDRFAVTPFAAVQYLQLWQRAYTEASSAGFGVPGILGLSFQSRTVSSLPTFLGAEINTRIALAHGAVWAPFVRASWVHEFMPDRTVAAAMGILPTGTFIVDGPRAARDAARIEAGSNFYLTKNIAIFGNFVGEYSGHTSSNAGNGGIRVTW